VKVLYKGVKYKFVHIQTLNLNPTIIYMVVIYVFLWYYFIMHVQSRKQQIELVVTQENNFDKEVERRSKSLLFFQGVHTLLTIVITLLTMYLCICFLTSVPDIEQSCLEFLQSRYQFCISKTFVGVCVSFLFVFWRRRLWVRKHRCFLEGGNIRASVATKKKKKKQALV